MTKCPKCEKILSGVNISLFDGRAPDGTRYKCVSYDCPFCFSSISIQMDPVAIKASTIAAIKGL